MGFCGDAAASSGSTRFAMVSTRSSSCCATTSKRSSRTAWLAVAAGEVAQPLHAAAARPAEGFATGGGVAVAGDHRTVATNAVGLAGEAAAGEVGQRGQASACPRGRSRRADHHHAAHDGSCETVRHQSLPSAVKYQNFMSRAPASGPRAWSQQRHPAEAEQRKARGFGDRHNHHITHRHRRIAECVDVAIKRVG